MINLSENEIIESWVNVSDRPEVTVRCLTYNHEKYLARALDSFLSQKTTFRFELLIHDDCSTDGTKDIIRQYMERYPNIVKAVIEEKNVFSTENGFSKIMRIMNENTAGRYVADCEGDDYWIAKDKLQRQYDALEANPHINVSAGKTVFVIDGKEDYEKTLPNKRLGLVGDQYIDSDKMAEIVFSQGEYPYHISSIFFRKEFTDDTRFESLYNLTEGDEITLRKVILYGGLYFIDDFLSAYAWMTDGSWTSSHLSQSNEQLYNHTIRQIKTNNYFDSVYENKYHRQISACNIKKLAYWYPRLDAAVINRDAKELVDEKELMKDKEFRTRQFLFTRYPGLAHNMLKMYRGLKKTVKHNG